MNKNVTGSFDGEKTLKNIFFGDTIHIRIEVPVFVYIVELAQNYHRY